MSRTNKAGKPASPAVGETVHQVLADANKAPFDQNARNYSCTADMWSAFMARRVEALGLDGAYQFSPQDVAMYLAMHSMSCIAADPAEDAYKVDLARHAAEAQSCGTE